MADKNIRGDAINVFWSEDEDGYSYEITMGDEDDSATYILNFPAHLSGIKKYQKGNGDVQSTMIDLAIYLTRKITQRQYEGKGD